MRKKPSGQNERDYLLTTFSPIRRNCTIRSVQAILVTVARAQSLSSLSSYDFCLTKFAAAASAAALLL